VLYRGFGAGRGGLPKYQPGDQSRLSLAEGLGKLAFYLIIDRQFAEAEACCKEAQGLVEKIGDGITKAERDDLIFIEQNLAHALLFQGRYDEALAIYGKNWSKPEEGRTFGEMTLEDFVAFEKAGLSNSDLIRIKRALTNASSHSVEPMKSRKARVEIRSLRLL
jgi:hypothetical protein